MKLDILVLAAHPDDAELAVAGTIIARVRAGREVGIVDLTRGELGTRGTPEIRQTESLQASKILGISVRETLSIPDAFFEVNQVNQLEVIKMIRKYQPEILITNAISDRHPDHARASNLVVEASFKSGLTKVETELDGTLQVRWRPKVLYHFIQDRYIQPDFIVDVSDFWEEKMKAIQAYKSQFYSPDSQEPSTFVSSQYFLEAIEVRGREFGHAIGTQYGEGFTVERTVGIRNLSDLI